MEFEWDVSKEMLNINKHQISFSESMASFYDPKGIQLIDEAHSLNEKRFYWVGKTKSGKILTTWFTRRDQKIRIIGCAEFRKMRSIYEENQEL